MSKRQLILAFVVLSLGMRCYAAVTFSTSTSGNLLYYYATNEGPENARLYVVHSNGYQYPYVSLASGAGPYNWTVLTVNDPPNTCNVSYYRDSAWTTAQQGYPVPTPTPTPTPSPTPSPDGESYATQIDIGDPVPEGYAATVQRTFTDNGETRYYDVNSADGTATVIDYNRDAGRAYKDDVIIWKMDIEKGTSTAVNYLELGSGTVGAAHTGSPVVVPGPTPSAPLTVTNVGSVVGQSGTSTPIQTVTGSGGTSTVVPSSGGTHVIYGTPTGTGSAQQFVTTSTNSIDVDLTDVKNLLRQGNLQRDIHGQATKLGLEEINKTLKANPSPSPASSANPLKNQSAVEGYYSSKLGSWEYVLPAGPSVNGPARGGGSSFWSLAGFGFNLNFDPASNAMVATLANWIYTFLTWYASAMLFMACQKLLWQTMTELQKIPQTDPPDLQTEVEALTFGGSFNLGAFVFPIYATFLVTVMAAGYVAISTALNTKVGFDLAGIAGSGSSVISSSGSGAFAAAWNLMLWFIPVTHFMTCFITYLWFAVGRVPIYMSWQAIRAWMSA